MNMQSNHTGSNNNLSEVKIAQNDKNICDIEQSDVDTTLESDLQPDVSYLSETDFSLSFGENVTCRSVLSDTSDIMTIPQVNESLNTRRASSISLKPIQTKDTDELDGCFSRDYDSDHECTNNGINVEFQNITYTVRRGCPWDRSTKTILNGVNGEFRAGELSAIMGPSGAGKSTLLDILTGYTTKLKSGKITINGRSRDLKLFRSQAAYIMQDDRLPMHIKVWEAMYFSVNLKIGSQLKRNEKKQRIESRYTKTGELSGGQRKRLAIALELVDNPQFMAFDEPTSGLDSSTSTQVVLLLKQLAQEGRTIVCTIHQPSASLFGLFDHLYAMAEGQCIYAGATEMLVPFLADLQLICPITYNPSDYLLEISTNDYGLHNERLVQRIKNGLNATYRVRTPTSIPNYSMQLAAKLINEGMITPVKPPEFAPTFDVPSKSITVPLKGGKRCCGSATYATSFCRQWYLLMARTVLCLCRDRSLAVTLLMIHLTVALLVVILYSNIGIDPCHLPMVRGALTQTNNFKYMFLSMMFLMFTSFCTMTIIFPLEMPIVVREHFNRWYSKKAYYVALSTADLPLQLICVLFYVLISYYMTAQPLELFRIASFFLIALLVTLISQGFGMIVGASCGVKLGVIIGPFLIAPFVVFSGLFLRISDAPPLLKWLFHSSYLKYALQGAAQSIYGFNRDKIRCEPDPTQINGDRFCRENVFCFDRDPKKFMKEINEDFGQYTDAIIVLISICVALRIIAFVVMALRLKQR